MPHMELIVADFESFAAQILRRTAQTAGMAPDGPMVACVDDATM